MNHDLKDTLVLIAALVSAFAAVVVPLMMYFQMKGAWSESWGKFQQIVSDHDRRITAVEGVQLQTNVLMRNHGERIVRLETATKVNGHAAGRA